ncbi:MAG TPA: diguanylate cyclase [Zoogloea sp.]|uniref:diguanylate cyclase domain-containing protein n=1 Tax=Zoogloea sp. TaxID=49181 RepID=UPI002CCEE104|nr:diguanylate cyclase [Zoogloea sp.]HMV19235.1 diguanylate cyclase [Rhodocyclaceae bacterium]HMV63097.1 diguanylate cyclase [Rhodocyclaceae bacterium]HMW51285.1 diguanylate cyclase [Rhodocyclaceae bacterium]HMY49845.1 diguanylate cyclase [Rhodocyclaceae bacterium]HMZ76603.1 diguanylate cyclase [Rhodocyclaceae bacterium]
MFIRIDQLIASPRRLLSAIVLFVVLDLAVLLINVWIAAQVAEDAVAINLAGRQRMLSQEITKALLLAVHVPSADARRDAEQELRTAYRLFERTLRAFHDGGDTAGGTGPSVHLRPIDPGAGLDAVERVATLMAPLDARLPEFLAGKPLADSELGEATHYMVQHNRDILAEMNRLTSALEQASVQRTRTLRSIQIGAFVLALGNFTVIVVGLVRRYRNLTQESQRWRRLAEFDPMTGLASRTAYREARDSTHDAAVRWQRSATLLLIDLDGFKPINDTFGHAVGDLLLAAVSERLRQVARNTDLVGRLGGDEFALICLDISAENDIGPLCERLLAEIAALTTEDGRRYGVTGSIGAAVIPGPYPSADAWEAAADAAMYAAKRRGGNAWRLASAV